MASRTSWEGHIRLNLLSVPVKAYNAAISGGGKVGFHLIHETCHNRIRYQKVCPVHGEVPNDEIVSAYEFERGQYVPVEAEERKKLLPEDDKALTIDTFIRPGDLDPMYYGDRSYYVVPDGKVAQKPYAVLQQVMAERQRFAVGRVVLSGRENVAIVRPVDGLLVMTLLNYDEEVKKPSEFEDDVPEVTVAPQERELAQSLVDATTADHFDFAHYKDEYSESLAKMLESKSTGKRATKGRRDEEPVILNLVDALRQSLENKQGRTSSKAPARREKSAAKKRSPARKTAKTAARKRKTG
jgi:DNA end-binding protein Ku